jgi:enolase
MFIKGVVPRLIKNSRGEKTIEVVFSTHLGSFVASAPSGKSIGKNEVPAYNHKGVEHSLILVKEFCKKFHDLIMPVKNFWDLKGFEKMIRDFEAKQGVMGANCTYALECAFLKAAAKENNYELWEFIYRGMRYDDRVRMPSPVGNCIGGGMHTKVNKGEKKPDFQEFLLIPHENRFSKAVSKMVHAYETAKKIIKKKEGRWFFARTNDENALITDMKNEDVLELMRKICKHYNLRLGVDVAASTFYNGWYAYKNKSFVRNRKEQIEFIQRLIERYNLFYVEDPMQEEDFLGFAELNNPKGFIVGDDLTTTNLARIKKAHGIKAINAVIIKPNQNGSLVEVAEIVKFCREKKIQMIFSHRSGETMDDALADFCIGFQGDFIKTGIMGKERLVKLRRIIKIEESLK